MPSGLTNIEFIAKAVDDLRYKYLIIDSGNSIVCGRMWGFQRRVTYLGKRLNASAVFRILERRGFF
jgi:hypothetical protein